MSYLHKDALLGMLLLCCSGVQAAIVTHNLNVEVMTGPYAGITGSGFFSYDDAVLTNIGHEELNPGSAAGSLQIELTVFGQTFHESDDIDYPDYPSLGLFDGVIQYLDFIVSENDPKNTTDIQYSGVTNFNIYDLLLDGNGSYFAELEVNVNPVPVPAAVWLFCSGLLGLFGMLGRKAQHS